MARSVHRNPTIPLAQRTPENRVMDKRIAELESVACELWGLLLRASAEFQDNDSLREAFRKADEMVRAAKLI